MKRASSMAVLVLALGAATLSAQAAPARPGAAGTVIRVRMLQNGARYVFEPANFSVRQGDIVEFVSISGGVHNVQFDKAKIPAGAEAVMNANMPNRLASLQGPMMTAPNQTYRISFAGAPVGTYGYDCLPHKAMGMVGVITVRAGAPGRR